jgi:hypothetical protein
MSRLITYKIVSDVDGRLKAATRAACNFWNRFLQPRASVVARIGTYRSVSATLARAYQPYTRAGVVYGVVEFNKRYLHVMTDDEVAGTAAHEIGHILGYGWSKWMTLFHHETGLFKDKPIAKVPSLAKMLVETDYGPGTELSHWDEEKFGAELMTGFKDEAEHVLPATIEVAALLGHKVLERLPRKTRISTLFAEARAVQFTRQGVAKALDLDHFEPTPVWEERYDLRRRRRTAFKPR